MKKILIYKLAFAFCLLFGVSKFSAQSNTINFTYDRAGNMVQRDVTVMPGGRPGIPPINVSGQKDDSLNVVEFKVYPNPTKDIVNIEGELPEGIENAKVFLYNNTGQILKRDNYVGALKSIIVSDLKAGIYYLEVSFSKKQASTYKIIITN